MKKTMKTRAQQLGVTKFPFIIKDEDGNKIYEEHSDGFWFKFGYDSNNNEISFENSKGEWYKREFDSLGRQIYHETSGGFGFKTIYNDPEDDMTYNEYLDGRIRYIHKQINNK